MAHDSGSEGLPIPGDGDRRFSVEHRLRSSARPAPPAPPLRPWYRGRIGRDVSIVVLIAAVALVVIPSADVPNSDYPEARAVADRLDSAWRSIGDGADAGETATAAGLVVATFEVAGRTVIVLSDSRPTTTGVCYAFRFGQGVLSPCCGQCNLRFKAWRMMASFPFWHLLLLRF